jgi:adenine-specific DNA-methyltransferase
MSDEVPLSAPSSWLPFLDSHGQSMMESVPRSQRATFGQYLSPAWLARRMVAWLAPLPSRARVLDPGAGLGILSAALWEHCSTVKHLQQLQLVSVEQDQRLAHELSALYEQRNTRDEAINDGWTRRVVAQDFVTYALEQLRAQGTAGEHGFDVVVMNPPYRKLARGTAQRESLKQVGLDYNNLYEVFVALGLLLLVPGGQLVAIVPRSFCNGPYFLGFRELLWRNAHLLGVQVFESRRQLFGRDSVLQENVILHLEKRREVPPLLGAGSKRRVPEVKVVWSGANDLEVPSKERMFALADVVWSEQQNMLVLPKSEEEELAMRWMQALQGTLAELGISVSTGRVVEFRARRWLRTQPAPGTVPLIYPCHFVGQKVAWPLKNSRKPNALQVVGETRAMVVPAGWYVLVKRCTSKEERRRLVAVVVDASELGVDGLAFENHVNFFHRQGAGLESWEARGLMMFLNSKVVEMCFRQFNGHTQVNANDLRMLRYPTHAQLARLAAKRHAGEDIQLALE